MDLYVLTVWMGNAFARSIHTFVCVYLLAFVSVCELFDYRYYLPQVYLLPWTAFRMYNQMGGGHRRVICATEQGATSIYSM